MTTTRCSSAEFIYIQVYKKAPFKDQLISMLFGTSTALICASSDGEIVECHSSRIVTWIAYMLFTRIWNAQVTQLSVNFFFEKLEKVEKDKH